MKNKSAVTLIELVIVIVIFVITFASLTPLVNKMRERANIIKCSDNVRLISLALHMYAADHNETFPDNLSGLYPGYIKKVTVFVCPASPVRGTNELPGYEYIAGLTESSPGTDVIIYDKGNNHGALGRNVVRVNGSVEWVHSTVGRPK